MSSSEFFTNIFSVQCIESRTGIVELHNLPFDSVRKVIRWFYSGDLAFDSSEFMTLYYLSRYLGIWQLERELRAELESASPRETLSFCAQCYENGYTEELKLLEVYLARGISSLAMEELSQVLDVATFARALKQSGLGNAAKVEMITRFIGDWNPTYEEKEALAGCLVKDATLKRLLTNTNYNWVNPQWVRTLPAK
jgi:hypothetical protein